MEPETAAARDIHYAVTRLDRSSGGGGGGGRGDTDVPTGYDVLVLDLSAGAGGTDAELLAVIGQVMTAWAGDVTQPSALSSARTVMALAPPSVTDVRQITPLLRALARHMLSLRSALRFDEELSPCFLVCQLATGHLFVRTDHTAAAGQWLRVAPQRAASPDAHTMHRVLAVVQWLRAARHMRQAPPCSFLVWHEVSRTLAWPFFLESLFMQQYMPLMRDQVADVAVLLPPPASALAACIHTRHFLARYGPHAALFAVLGLVALNGFLSHGLSLEALWHNASVILEQQQQQASSQRLFVVSEEAIVQLVMVTWFNLRPLAHMTLAVYVSNMIMRHEKQPSWDEMNVIVRTRVIDRLRRLISTTTTTISPSPSPSPFHR